MAGLLNSAASLIDVGTKFGRNYALYVQLQNGNTLTIAPPFTIEFDITRNTLSSMNVASIRVYNLSKENRDQIEFNIYNQGAYRGVLLQAGYGTNLSTIFSGNMGQAWSVREGVNFITQIESFDGGYAYNNATIETHFSDKTPKQLVIRSLLEALAPYQVSSGGVGTYPGLIGRNTPTSGNVCQLLRTYTGNGFFIDNQTANALGNSECLPGFNLPLINASTGLLGTPVREQQMLTFDMVFEPRARAGQLIELQSSTSVSKFSQSQAVNGVYKVTSVKHRGMISESICGTVITTLGMFLGGLGPDALVPVPTL